MSALKRPYEVTAAGWLLIVVGILNTAYHLWNSVFDRWMVAILFLTVSAIVAGVFLLRGARWRGGSRSLGLHSTLWRAH